MKAEALIVGGGLAGSALAISLARAGRAVTLIEKECAAHHKVCGEFLSREACLYLQDLGIDLERLGAVPITRVRLAHADTVAEISLPFQAQSLSRFRLDEALLEKATATGVTMRRGQRVHDIARNQEHWQAKLGAETITASDVFLGTGKHDLKNQKRSGLQNDLIAFKLHWRLRADQTEALKSCVELILFKGGYAGLEPVEEELANLCLVVRRRRFESVGSSWPDLLAAICAEAPHLAARLEQGEPVWPRPLAISAIPYGYVRREARDGLWRLGDQAAVIPSLAGDGMSIALHSARLAASSYLSRGTAHAYQRRLARDVRAPVYLATALSQLLVRSYGQKALITTAKLLPFFARASVLSTRIPERRLLAGC